MSKYENYDEVSKVFDEHRGAAGCDVIAGLLHVYGNKPLKDLHLLDAGCGTGNYAKELINHGIGKVTLLDNSDGMLDVAKNKIKESIDKKTVDQVVQAKLPAMPFNPASFDAVLFSLVLHHLEDNTNGKYFPATEDALREAKRVLRPSGILILTTVLPSVFSNAFWYSQLNGPLIKRFCKRFPAMQQYLSMFDKYGFQCVSKLNVLGTQTKGYKDPEGPLKEDWRKGDSLFAEANEQEINDIKQFVQEMTAKGTMKQFIDEHDRTLEIGALTILMCIAR